MNRCNKHVKNVVKVAERLKQTDTTTFASLLFIFITTSLKEEKKKGAF